MKTIPLILLFILGAGALCLLYGFFIEPRWIKVRKILIPAREEKSYQGMTLLFFSDLHVGKRTKAKDLTRMVQKILEAGADAVIFGGDLVEESTPLWDPDFQKMVTRHLAKIEAPLGKWAILGNHDTEAPRYRAWTVKVLEDAGFTILENEAANWRGLPVWGFADFHHEQPIFHEEKFQKALGGVDKEANPFTLYLIHESDWFPETMPTGGPGLVLSGHSHYGQVTLFGLPLIRPDGAKTYWRGRYVLPDKLSLIVSAGMGTVHIHARFFARPDFLLIRFGEEVRQ